MYTLSIIGRPEYNGTKVVGVAKFFNGLSDDETFPAAILQGMYMEYTRCACIVITEYILLIFMYATATVSMNTTDGKMSGKII